MIDINMDGPMIEGTWYNPQTGDSFTVRDSYFQDSNLLIAATDGRVFDYNTIQNYVKSDKPISKQPKQPQRKEVPAEIESMIETSEEEGLLEEDAALLKGTSTPTRKPQVITPTQPTMSEDDIIINRILSRVEPPKINLTCKWTKFPEKQLDMLVDMMGVSEEDIAKYFINKLDGEELRGLLVEAVSKSLKPKVAEPAPVKTPKVIKTSKKSTK